MPLPSDTRLGLLAAIAAPVAWSFGGPVMRLVEAGPWEQVFWRALGGAAATAILLLAHDRRGALHAWRAAGPAMATSSALIGATFVIHVLAINATTVANVLVLQTINPLIMPLLAWAMLGERAGFWTLAAIALASVGLGTILVDSFGGGRPAGDLLALAAAACGALNIIVVRRARGTPMTGTIVAGGLVAMAVAAMFGAPLATRVGDAALLALLGIVQMTLGLWCFLFALRRLPAAPVALLTLIEPVLGPLLVWLAVGERPANATLIGGAAILAALALNVVGTLRRPADS